MLIDIIVQDAWVICMSRVVHIAFVIYVTWYRHEIALCIAYAPGHRMNGCEMVIINTAFGV